MGNAGGIGSRYRRYQIAILDGIKKGKYSRYLKCLGRRVLATVIVDLHQVKALKIHELIKEEVDRIPAHSLGESRCTRELALAIREGLVADGEMMEKKHGGARRRIHSPGFVMAVEQGRHME